MDARRALVIVLLSALAACGEKAAVNIEAAGPASTAAKALPEIAPAIIPPDEVANPTEPPSYEVAIATAASARNKALARCETQPEAVRTQCTQEANAAYADVETDLQNLRGNQE